jgi:hypothetical protein
MQHSKVGFCVVLWGVDRRAEIEGKDRRCRTAWSIFSRSPPRLLADADKCLHGGCQLPPLGSAHHRVYVPAAAPGAHQPLSPYGNVDIGAIAADRLGRLGFNLMLAIPALHDQADAVAAVDPGVLYSGGSYCEVTPLSPR